MFTRIALAVISIALLFNAYPVFAAANVPPSEAS